MEKKERRKKKEIKNREREKKRERDNSLKYTKFKIDTSRSTVQKSKGPQAFYMCKKLNKEEGKLFMKKEQFNSVFGYGRLLYKQRLLTHDNVFSSRM